MPGRYSTSSQSADWLLTEEEIAVHRKKSREQAAAQAQGPQTGATPGLANILLSPFPNAAESPMVAAAAPVVLSRQSSGGGQQLSNDEAAALLLHHEVRIREICDKMYKRKLFKKGAAGKTEADENMFMTSITYFKRFYLYKSVEEASPTAIMLAAIYTATKIEEVWYDRMLDELLRDAGDRDVETLLTQTAAAATQTATTDAAKAAVVEHEMSLLAVLKFHLVVYHPIRPLRSIVDQFATWQTAQATSVGTTPLVNAHVVETLHRRGTRQVGYAYCTDLPLLYPPSQIATGALWLIAEREGQAASETWPVVQSSLRQFLTDVLLKKPEEPAAREAASSEAGNSSEAIAVSRDVTAKLLEAEEAVKQYMAGGVGTQKAETLTRRLLHVGRSAPGGTALLPPPPLTAGKRDTMESAPAGSDGSAGGREVPESAAKRQRVAGDSGPAGDAVDLEEGDLEEIEGDPDLDVDDDDPDVDDV